ncbi:hypothetical protein [Aureimonas fodinaquatilis]|uniref:hypothetical protein n=1 Tax=Aureimonas fodinaquatilis TaxID=2565783 RepID=UPI00165EB5CE|nr:hypothetical protein [Aureimonas fodinaquatilis]
MVFRLATLTLILAAFAVGFSTHVKSDGGNQSFAYVSSCYDQGLVCAPQGGLR